MIALVKVILKRNMKRLLQGEKSVVKNLTNKQGEVVETITTYEGEPGKDLVTTIDMELQQEAEQIVEEVFITNEI